MQQPRTTLEHFEAAIVQERNLAERLAREMVGLAALERDGADGVGQAGLLAGLSQPQVAHEAARAFGNPVQGPDGQFAHLASLAFVHRSRSSIIASDMCGLWNEGRADAGSPDNLQGTLRRVQPTQPAWPAAPGPNERGARAINGLWIPAWKRTLARLPRSDERPSSDLSQLHNIVTASLDDDD